MEQMGKRYINREISWLQFNARVLQESQDNTVPLLERLRFIGIFSNNLDEFFKVRYATVQHINLAGKTGKRALRGMDARQLLEQITNIVIKQQAESLIIIRKIQEELENHNIYVIKEHQVNSSQGEYLHTFFRNKVSPALMTFMLDDLDEFPHLKDSAAYLAVKLKLRSGESDKNDGDPTVIYSLIEIPKSIDRFVVLPVAEDGKEYIMFLDDVIRYCMGQI